MLYYCICAFPSPNYHLHLFIMMDGQDNTCQLISLDSYFWNWITSRDIGADINIMGMFNVYSSDVIIIAVAI